MGENEVEELLLIIISWHVVNIVMRYTIDYFNVTFKVYRS